jgi:hypothetical protein
MDLERRFTLEDFLDDRVAALTGWLDRHGFHHICILLE